MGGSTNFYHGGGVTEIRVVKQADETIQSSTTPQADNELLYPLEANSRYRIEVYAIFVGGVLSDFKMSYSIPSGAISSCTYLGRGLTGVATTTMSVAGDALSARVDVGSGYEHCYPLIINILTSLTAGNFQFQWAQNTSVAEDTTVKAGSHLIIRKLE